ncbi:CRISPR-associated protein Csx16 [Azoarcus sp. PA01]|nr:CRISPR-associated protein Csx16 [Azoarcus sp. PA01]KON82651.2 CRISPR-associated protein Csx16 [Azoarcus sp. PA01]
MKLWEDRIELTGHEPQLLALACQGRPRPALTAEVFAEWLLEPMPDELPALCHGARLVLREHFVAAFAVPTADDTAGITWAVTRHPAALVWLHSQGIRPQRVVAHLDPTQPAPGDVVAGILPLSLAASLHRRGVRCINLSIDAMWKDRGRELTVARMRECGARLEIVQEIDIRVVARAVETA